MHIIFKYGAPQSKIHPSVDFEVKSKSANVKLQKRYLQQYSFCKDSSFHGVLFLSPKCRMLTLSLPTTQHYEERESVYGAFRAEK